MKSGKRIMGKLKCVMLVITAALMILPVKSSAAAGADKEGEQENDSRTEEQENDSRVDPERMCSLTLEIPGAFQNELYEVQIPVRLYRIGDITEEGSFRILEEYDELDLKQSVFANAQSVKEKAQEAAELLNVGRWEEELSVEPDQEINIVCNSATLNGLQSGLYLICVKEIEANNAVYEALPYLISLPGMMESTSGGEDTPIWEYDMVAELKLKKEIRSVPWEPQEENPLAVEEPEESPTVEESEGPAVIEFLKTGDDTGLLILVVAALCSGITVAVICILRRRSRKKHQSRS